MSISGAFLFQQVVLAFITLVAGCMIAAGIFAFLVMIGVFPRLIGKTNTRQHILLFEIMIIIGGICGNLLGLYKPSILIGSDLFLGTFGFMVGVFVGCLVMSLAETLKALPIISRRIHLVLGLEYVILFFGIGKLAGALFYFSRGMGL